MTKLIFTALLFTLNANAIGEATLRYSSSAVKYKIRINDTLIDTGSDASGTIRLFNENHPNLKKFLDLAQKHGGSMAEVRKNFVLKQNNRLTITVLKTEKRTPHDSYFLIKILSKKGEEKLKAYLKSKPVILDEEKIRSFSDVLYKKLSPRSKPYSFKF